MKRIQFELPEEKVAELERLMDESGIKTRKDLLNNALMLLEMAIKERKEGRTLVSVDEKKNRFKEVLMPILSSIQPATTNK
jgi:metal-responsive CopG/Arc/MetJ family transcriptional regulator